MELIGLCAEKLPTDGRKTFRAGRKLLLLPRVAAGVDGRRGGNGCDDL
jgi:hypothetical protein